MVDKDSNNIFKDDAELENICSNTYTRIYTIHKFHIIKFLGSTHLLLLTVHAIRAAQLHVIFITSQSAPMYVEKRIAWCTQNRKRS